MVIDPKGFRERVDAWLATFPPLSSKHRDFLERYLARYELADGKPLIDHRPPEEVRLHYWYRWNYWPCLATSIAMFGEPSRGVKKRDQDSQPHP